MTGGSIGARIRRFARVLGIVLAAIAAATALSGAIYQEVGVRRDRARYPAPGELVSIGTHSLHLHCAGDGAPTVLLDAGAGGWSLHWWGFREGLAREGRVCAFDRSGLGWSDDGVGVYDGEGLARELHAVLGSADTGPVVYVGHSLGANLAQIHARLFPEDVAGMVLIDPGRPVDMLEDFEGTRDDAAAIEGCGWKCVAASVATRLGLVRFATRNAGRNTLSAERQALYHAGLSRQTTTRTVIGYLDLLPKTAWQNIDSDDFQDIPLTVVYSSDTRRPEGDETEDDVARWHREVLADMETLAARSTRGRGPVVIEGATHTSIVTDTRFIGPVIEEIRYVARLTRSPGDP